VAHPLVDALINRRTHASKDASGFMDPFERNVSIDIAAAEKDRRAA
jgi:hypothetical protein